MTIGEIVDAVQGEVMCGEDRMFEVVEYAFASDLMSDVLTIKIDNFLLVTGLANVQSIRTAEMSDVRYIIFVRGKAVTDEMIDLADENGMVVIDMRLEYDVAAGDFTRAGFASSSIKKALKQLGVSPAVVKRVVIAVYEAEVNIVAHANGGRITADIEPDGINVVLADTGPGIPDVEKAMQKGFSTASKEVREMGFGAGMGLPNIKENADSLRIETEVGKGTTLYIYIKF